MVRRTGRFDKSDDPLEGGQWSTATITLEALITA